MTKIIVFNGPPNCGKDEAVSYLKRQFGVHPFSFKTELFRLTQTLFCVTEAQWNSWYTREGKELPRPELGGKSCRQALIYVSEMVVKPSFGKDWFGKVEAHKLHQISMNESLTAACSDGGFDAEIHPLVNTFGPENVHIVRIFRQGCSFEGDSRTWIETKAVPSQNYWSIQNNRPLGDYWDSLYCRFNDIVNPG